jgi:hypothetical protein
MKDDNKIKEQIMGFTPSTLETIDYSVYEWVNNELNIFAASNKGNKKVPIVWVANERSFQIKNNKDLKDKDGALIFPMMTIQRNSFEKSPTDKGVFYGNIIPVNDAKGGSITIARKIKQDKTANFLNANTYRKKANIVGNAGYQGTQQINFPDRRKASEKKIVYETITVPMPVYVNVNYTIRIRTEYQQQMNEIIQPFAVFTNAINYLILKRDGHMYEGFIQPNFSTNNDITNLGTEARIYETEITLNVLGYLIGADTQQERPNIVKRENAVEIKIPRERTIVGDEPDWPDGKYRS